MKYTEDKDPNTRSNKVTVEIGDLEIVGLKLDAFERRLLDEVGKSGKVSDKLLALEMLARRIEENE